ncbi:MAG: hypothetical protein M1282_05000, partial [Chloroflexi bacterium]|nr:hypothetical protein [Chloroflexota bacterium]
HGILRLLSTWQCLEKDTMPSSFHVIQILCYQPCAVILKNGPPANPLNFWTLTSADGRGL